MATEFILPILIIFDISGVGFLLTNFFKLKFFLEAKITAGILIGITLLGILVLAISYLFGLNFLSLSFALIVINTLGIILLKENKFEKIQNDWIDFRKRAKERSWRLFFLFIGFFISIFGYLTSQLFTLKDGSFFVQPVHAYGDISLHLGIISSFAYGNNFPPHNPILAGTKISYPFLFDFITAIFINPLSLTLDQSIALTGTLMMTILIVLFIYFSYEVTKNKLSACLTITLFFFNGGLGFLYFFHDFQTSNLNFFYFLRNLPQDYTALKDLDFWWINVVISMFLPQRSFLFGLPIAILILYLFWDLSGKFQIRKLSLAVLLISLLPIIHAHSLIALSPFLVYLSILIIFKNKLFKDRDKILISFCVGMTGIIMIFILSKLFLQQSENLFSLIKFKLGWMAGKKNIAEFYFKNFGFNLFYIPLAVFYTIKKKMKIGYLGLIAQIWFIIPSLFIFQPWDFDNTKLFIYWYLFSSIILAVLIKDIVETRKALAIILTVFIIFLINFSGVLDIIRLLYSPSTRYEVYSPKAIRLAEFVKDNTNKDATFLSVDKFDNPIVTLAGRKVIVGYHSWLWTYGLDYLANDLDVRRMLAGDETFYKKYNVSYIILFPEKNEYLINYQYIRNKYKLIYGDDGYELYEI